jgi:hypothetical protein
VGESGPAGQKTKIEMVTWKRCFHHGWVNERRQATRKRMETGLSAEKSEERRPGRPPILVAGLPMRKATGKRMEK